MIWVWIGYSTCRRPWPASTPPAGDIRSTRSGVTSSEAHSADFHPHSPAAGIAYRYVTPHKVSVSRDGEHLASLCRLEHNVVLSSHNRPDYPCRSGLAQATSARPAASRPPTAAPTA